MDEYMYTGKSSKNPYKPFIYGFIIFLALTSFGVHDYFDIANAEQNGTSIYINSFQYGLYKLGGKLAASGFVIFIAIICLIAGILSTTRLIKIKNKNSR